MEYVVIRRDPGRELGDGFPQDPEMHAYGPLDEERSEKFAARLREVNPRSTVEVLSLEVAHEAA